MALKLSPQEVAIQALFQDNGGELTKDQLEEHFKFPLPVICRMRKKGVRIETVRVWKEPLRYRLQTDDQTINHSSQTL